MLEVLRLELKNTTIIVAGESYHVAVLALYII